MRRVTFERLFSSLCSLRVPLLILFGLALLIWAGAAFGAETPRIELPKITIGEETVKGPKSLVLSFQILILLTTLSLAPYLLIMTTSFIRISIVLSFIRSALGTQQVPPTQVLMGLALFMTIYVMMPVLKDVNEQAVRPYMKGKMSQMEALQKAGTPIQEFMLKNVREKDLALFVSLAKMPRPKTKKEVPLHVLVPAFMISEVKTAFEIGFIVYLPFLVIDMIVASVLMSMGMFMLSPMSISLPFKLLLFVMIDGWELVIKGMISSFR
ncbi:MAG: flagellar type III secretion system pore protein FliP [Armatimonadetes bacterium]|nr:flagellar type III secretion system pore protein FliP [Armatimonadota bacterium]